RSRFRPHFAPCCNTEILSHLTQVNIMSNTSQEIPIPDGVLLDQLESTATPATKWIWRGYLARGSVTLLTSVGKTGQTTLLAALLSRLREGEIGRAHV